MSQYSQTGQLLYQENTSKGVAIDDIYLAGSLVATRERNADDQALTTKYQHTDALGSPVAVTNEAGAGRRAHELRAVRHGRSAGGRRRCRLHRPCAWMRRPG